jgi:hypothetical protein
MDACELLKILEPVHRDANIKYLHAIQKQDINNINNNVWQQRNATGKLSGSSLN